MRAVILATALVLATAGSAAAEPSFDKGPMTISVDPDLVVPIGDLSDGIGLGLGASATLDVPLNFALSVTGRTGLIYHLPKNDVTGVAVPLLGGVRYALSPQPQTFYVAGELGLFYLRASGEILGQTVSDSDTELGATIGGGYRTSFADFRGGLQIYDLGEIDNSLSIMLSASFQIASL